MTANNAISFSSTLPQFYPHGLYLTRWWQKFKMLIFSQVMRSLATVRHTSNSLTLSTVILNYLSKYKENHIQLSTVLGGKKKSAFLKDCRTPMLSIFSDSSDLQFSITRNRNITKVINLKFGLCGHVKRAAGHELINHPSCRFSLYVLPVKHDVELLPHKMTYSLQYNSHFKASIMPCFQ